MSLLPVTLFTTCKPFHGETAVMQENALCSWARLGVPILVFGDEPGVEEICARTGATHIPDIDRSDSGVPLLSSLFDTAKALSTTGYLAYVNADIILRGDFTNCLQSIDSAYPSLVVARRQNIPLNQLLPDAPSCDQILNELVEQFGNWDEDNAIDLFVFHRDLFYAVVPLAIGRMQWDNWLLWQAKQEGARIIDATGAISLLHPFHGYASHTEGWQEVTQGTDAERNRDLCKDHLLDISEAATHFIHNHELLAHTEEKAPLSPKVRFTPNSYRAIRGALHHLLTGLTSRPIVETVDCIRNLLWSHEVFFPLTNQQRDWDCASLGTQLRLSKTQLDAGDTQACLQTLQNILVSEMVERAQQQSASGRPLLIWGAGQLGQRLQALFDRLQIQFMGFLDSNRQLVNETINGKPVIANDWQQVTTGTGNSPYIFIASMYYREIANSLKATGLTQGQDFWA